MRWHEGGLNSFSDQPLSETGVMRTRLSDAIPSYQHIMFANLELERGVAEDLALANRNAEVFDDNLRTSLSNPCRRS